MPPLKKKQPAKQALLNIASFVPDPSKTLVKKHKRLAKKLAAVGRPKVDKVVKKRLEEEKAAAEGTEKWRVFLYEAGIQDVDSCQPYLLYLSNGNNGPLAFHSDEDLRPPSDDDSDDGSFLDAGSVRDEEENDDAGAAAASSGPGR